MSPRCAARAGPISPLRAVSPQKKLRLGRPHKQRATNKAVASAAERVGLDEAFVLRNLKRNAIMEMRSGDRAAANRALEIIAKHLGMLIERKEVAISHVDDADEYLAKMMTLIEPAVIEHQPLTNGGLKDGMEMVVGVQLIDSDEE
jgi:hypothetical protein